MVKWRDKEEVKNSVADEISQSIPDPVSLVKVDSPEKEEESKYYCQVRGTKEGYSLTIKSTNEKENKLVLNDYSSYYPFDSVGTWHKRVAAYDDTYVRKEARSLLREFLESKQRITVSYEVWLDS